MKKMNGDEKWVCPDRRETQNSQRTTKKVAPFEFKGLERRGKRKWGLLGHVLGVGELCRESGGGICFSREEDEEEGIWALGGKLTNLRNKVSILSFLSHFVFNLPI